MSRTDKDRPYWVVTDWYAPRHRWHCPEGRGSSDGQPCTLPNVPVIHARIFGADAPCHWEALWPKRLRYRYTWGPTKEDRHLQWYGPDRARVRDVLAKARQQYNGSGDVEIIEPAQNHRHHPLNGWWD